MKNEIQVIIGPSSSGKSTFIETLNIPSSAIIMAKELNTREIPTTKCIIHYNTFRIYKNNYEEYLKKEDLFDDIPLKKIISQKHRVTFYLLIVNKNILKKRILLRDYIEKNLRQSKEEYPSLEISRLVYEINLENEYKKWINYFKSLNIDYLLIDSNKSKVEILPPNKFNELVNLDIKVDYSDKEIDFILKKFRFEYQSISLPFNKKTSGKSRENTLSKIFKIDLNGKSLLDVGSAYGYFCFEAEKRGCSEVLGTEIKPHRYIGANILKDILKSNVSFIKRDIITSPIEKQFDIVLLLNVIHHLPFPFYSLKIISEYCKELLIIEFPTMSDKIFQKTLSKKSILSKFLNPFGEKPIIGVSLLGERDQTFVFSQAAIERVLIHNNKWFKRIEFIDSPISKERKIAFCYKN